MVFPRQRLYDVNHFGFIKAVLSRRVNMGEGSESLEKAYTSNAAAFEEYTGIQNFIPLSRGRLAGYFATKCSVSQNKRKVVMSAFTIFDLVNMVILGGGEPHFVDTDKGGVHLSLETVKSAIDDETAAVFVTHYHSSNPDIEEIARFCKSKGIFLIEDCAISLGSRVNGQHVGSFGDFALFSFGLFKFVSTYYGGGVIVKDRRHREAVIEEMGAWPRMNATGLSSYAAKGMKLSLLTEKNIFNSITFPLFRLGFSKNLEFIKKQAQNDPNPVAISALPEAYKVRPSLFQLQEFCRQIPMVEKARKIRVKNAQRYHNNLTRAKITGLPAYPDPERDCYLNFPLLLNVEREKFICEMMESGFDLAQYYYRNCAAIPAFNKYFKPLPNLDEFVDNMVFFPTYPGVDDGYIDALTSRVVEILN